jgi:hypothetical protein
MLEFNFKEGWEPLCEFLGKEKPEGEFLRLNDAQAFKDRVPKVRAQDLW